MCHSCNILAGKLAFVVNCNFVSTEVCTDTNVVMAHVKLYL